MVFVVLVGVAVPLLTLLDTKFRVRTITLGGWPMVGLSLGPWVLCLAVSIYLPS